MSLIGSGGHFASSPEASTKLLPLCGLSGITLCIGHDVPYASEVVPNSVLSVSHVLATFWYLVVQLAERAGANCNRAASHASSIIISRIHVVFCASEASKSYGLIVCLASWIIISSDVAHVSRVMPNLVPAASRVLSHA